MHDGIKTIQDGVFLFSLKKTTKSCFFFKNTKNWFKQKNQVGCYRFFSTLCPKGFIFWDLAKYVRCHKQNCLISKIGSMKICVSKVTVSSSKTWNKIKIIQIQGLRMRNFTWNRFPIKILLIDSLLTPIAESSYSNPKLLTFI